MSCSKILLLFKSDHPLTNFAAFHLLFEESLLHFDVP